MSRITKEIAKEVALSLTKLKKEEISKLNEKISSRLEDIILSKIPDEVKKCFSKNKKFFNTRSGFQLSGNGFDYQHFNTINSIPYGNNSSYTPTELEANELLPMINKVQDLKVNYNKLLLEVESLLYNLRTYSKVVIEFPEAEPFLPKTMSNKLMININDIRDKLK